MVPGFRPGNNDIDGLSLFREIYHTPQEIVDKARGPRYYVAYLRAGDLRQKGMVVDAQPTAEFAGHCVISNLNAANKRTDECENWQAQLRTHLQCKSPTGPLHKSAQ